MKKLNSIKRAQIIVVFAFVVVAVLSLFIKQYGLIATLGAAIITSYLGWLKYWMDTDNFFLNLFISFNKRFDDLNEDLNLIMKGEEVNERNGKRRTKEQVVQDYLNLCSEEYYWHTKGRIPTEVRTPWKGGIDYYLQSEFIKAYFLEESQYNETYYKLFDELNISA